MAFADVGCGTNGCWFQWILYVRIFLSIVVGGTILKRRTDSLVSASAAYQDTNQLMVIDLILIGLTVLNLYFLFCAVKANQSARCEHHLWRRWSHYMKTMMVIFGIGGGLAALATLALGTRAGGYETSVAPIQAAFYMVFFVGSALVGDGLLLLLTKNRYEEKLRSDEATRRGGEEEFLKPV